MVNADSSGLYQAGASLIYQPVPFFVARLTAPLESTRSIEPLLVFMIALSFTTPQTSSYARPVELVMPLAVYAAACEGAINKASMVIKLLMNKTGAAFFILGPPFDALRWKAGYSETGLSIILFLFLLYSPLLLPVVQHGCNAISHDPLILDI